MFQPMFPMMRWLSVLFIHPDGLGPVSPVDESQ
jgi:hypothetical protein